MSVQVLIYAGPDSDSSDKMAWKKGYPISLHDYTHKFGVLDLTNDRFLIKIVDADRGDLEYLFDPWIRKLNYRVLSYNPETQIYRIAFFSDLTGPNNEGVITIDEIEGFVSSWGIHVDDDSSDNDVRITISVRDILTSRNFLDFGDELEPVEIRNISHDPETGLYTVELDYFNSALEADVIITFLEEKGCRILSCDRTLKNITFEVVGREILLYFFNKMKLVFDIQVNKSRWKIDISGWNNGEEITLSEFQNKLIDLAE